MLQQLLLYTVLLVSLHIAAQPAWHLVRDKNGIKVYTANIGSSSLKQIKAEATINGTPDKLVAIFVDIPKQRDWVYSTKRSYLIKKISDKEFLYYEETALPWPIANRDLAIRMDIDVSKADDALTITMADEPNTIPVHDGIVRVPHFTSTWKIKSVEKNKLRIDYYLDVNPGGDLPAWIVNMFAAKGPYETLNNLATLLKS